MNHPTIASASVPVSVESPQPTAPLWRRWWPLLLVLLTAVGATLRYGPPAERPETAPPETFSAARAFHHVEAIAASPHARGTPQNIVVRDYLVAELKRLGLSSELRQGVAAPIAKEPRLPVPVENIVAKIPSTATGPAVMLVAHYDSAPKAPGAGDDGAGVAALLETARALRSAAPLRNDVLLVFTDGEELGMLGARTFVADPEALKAIGVVLNFDARGTSGPSIMFETSANNRALIAEFARAAPHIVATSLTASVYRWLPNRTDFTVFQKAGLPGLNFAFIGGSRHYHKASDTPANLDRRTLQQTGDYALSLARHFGAISLPVAAQGDAVYFTVIPPWFAHYPMAWVMPLTIALLIVAISVGWLAARRGDVSWARVARAGLAMSVGVLVAAALAWAVYASASRLGLDPKTSAVPLAISAALAIGVAWILGSRIAPKTGPSDRYAAVLSLWTVLAAVAGLALPGGAHLFFWPALVGWVTWQVFDRQIHTGAAWSRLLPGLTAAVLVGPTLFLLYTALGAALPLIAAWVVLTAFWVLPSE